MYRGMIKKSNQERVLTYIAYSFIDLVADSGGLATALMYIIRPIAGLFSKLKFELGVLTLLFSARTFNKDAVT